MDINDESKIIIESINKTIDEFKECSKSCRSEEDLQLRLYQNLCNELGNNSYKRISGEYPVYENQQKEHNREYAKKFGKKRVI